MYFYCTHCQKLDTESIHRMHHDELYGIALSEDNELFGRLLLEINQAGLSWNTILQKQENFRSAYSNFDIQTIANYNELDTARLLSDAGIIRNRLKVHAAIFNAQKLLEIQKEFDSFFNWIKIQKAENTVEWVKLFKKQFKFVGGEICNEFLMTIGRIEGAHSPDCHRYRFYKEKQSLWH
jgi:DNA-3-methyladenine glycosylase I